MSKVRVMLVAALLGLAGIGLYQKDVVADSTSGSINLTDGSMNIQKVWVYNQDAVVHTVGSLMCYVPSASATYPGLSVSTTVTSNSGLVAGVVVDATLPANGWGWIQTRGYTDDLKITGTIVVGDGLITTTTAEKAGQYTVLLATGNASQTSNAPSVFGRALDSATSSSTIKAILFGL